MNKFYTNIFQRGNYLYVRGVDDGTRFMDRIEFLPTVWIDGKIGSSDPWKTLDGRTVYPFQPGGIRDTAQYVESNKDIYNKNVYSSPGHAYQYIADNYKGPLSWDKNYVLVYSMDIETQAEGAPLFSSDHVIKIRKK